MHQNKLRNAKLALREVVAAFLIFSGIPALVNAVIRRGRATIVLYHDPSPEVLERHLQFLKRRYRIITLDQLLDELDEPLQRTSDKPSLVITIDDGHAGNVNLLPVLSRHGVCATLYVCSAIVGTQRQYWWQAARENGLDVESLKNLSTEGRLARLAHVGWQKDHNAGCRSALSADELKALKPFVSLQSHTRFHPTLTGCDDQLLETETFLSRREVEELSGEPCMHFAYPDGSYDERIVDCVRRGGYRSARTCDVGWIDFRTDRYRLRCMPIADDASPNWLIVQLAGLSKYLLYLRAGSFLGRCPQ